ncbi:MAG: Gfo/Idh/MocA family oxidoreductase [Chloroflexota bacterium]
MYKHSPISISIIASNTDNRHQSLFSFLKRTSSQLTISTSIPQDFGDTDVVMISDSKLPSAAEWERISGFVSHGGGCFTFSSPEQWQLPSLFGVQPCETETFGEFRNLFTDKSNCIAQRLPDYFYARGLFQPLEIHSSSAEIVLYADWRYKHKPMLVTNRHDRGLTAVTTILETTNPIFQQIIYRLLRQLSGEKAPQESIGVGLLGYAPSVGLLHGSGAAATVGMNLKMVCDLSERRLSSAKATFPDVELTKDAEALGNSPDVDLVIIATPPNSHANLAKKMLQSGKHVICEKPLALTVDEAESMQATAVKHNRHLSCHQNRRWDSDYRMIKQAIVDHLIGKPFYLETFVGGYGHPCGFWHSHDAVSGGTTYDWGAHYLDWMLDLMPDEISGVICTRQNRLWHDITNADRERIQLRYKNGAEAEFTHSDLAYIPKPKWYMVGTEGAIVGHWREMSAYQPDPIQFYQKHDIPSAEMGADIQVKRRDKRGQLFEQTLPEPKRDPFPFHKNLADYLLLGEPLEVPLTHSMRVVSVLEAAKRSAENGGRLEDVKI